jgi:hypothetical protein
VEVGVGGGKTPTLVAEKKNAETRPLFTLTPCFTSLNLFSRVRFS